MDLLFVCGLVLLEDVAQKLIHLIPEVVSGVVLINFAL